MVLVIIFGAIFGGCLLSIFYLLYSWQRDFEEAKRKGWMEDI